MPPSHIALSLAPLFVFHLPFGLCRQLAASAPSSTSIFLLQPLQFFFPPLSWFFFFLTNSASPSCLSNASQFLQGLFLPVSLKKGALLAFVVPRIPFRVSPFPRYACLDPELSSRHSSPSAPTRLMSTKANKTLCPLPCAALRAGNTGADPNLLPVSASHHHDPKSCQEQDVGSCHASL